MEMYVNVAIKFLVALLCIVIVIRFIGQKELSQTAPIDLVFMIILADIVGGMVSDKRHNITHIIFIVVIGDYPCGVPKN